MQKIVVIGAFGNVGMHVINQLIPLGFEIRCFDLQTPLTMKKAKLIQNHVQIFWGDLTKPETVEPVISDADYVIHLAAIIPPLSERNKTLAYNVNVIGTQNIITGIQKAISHPKLIFTSSVSVFGYTQLLDPPRKVMDPLNPTDNYSTTKVTCEELIKNAGCDYIILRLGAANPVELGQFDPIMFDIPLSTRIEFVHPSDVGLAIINSLNNPHVWGKVFLIGGGPSCQMFYRDYVTRILDVFGIDPLPDQAFSSNKPFYTDWLDTTESQFLLKYQQHSFESYAQEMKNLMGIKHFFVEMFRLLVKKWLLTKSPYYSLSNHTIRVKV